MNINKKIATVNDFANSVLDVLNVKGSITTTDFLQAYIDFQNKLGVKVSTADDDDNDSDSELKMLKSEDEKFVQVTGESFTIKNARIALLNSAKTALDYFYDDKKDKAESAKKKFHTIFNALPRQSLPDIVTFIFLEIVSHLQLDYGNLATDWLMDSN